MKNFFYILSIALFASFFISSCTESPSNKKEENIEKPTDIDLCRCLTEPGNSSWSSENKVACRDAISKEIGVENWEKVNFSQKPKLNKKWEQLIQKCSGISQLQSNVVEPEKLSDVLNEIGTSYGYIWESINSDAQIYSTLSFDDLNFRTTAYAMNNETNSENFTKIIELSGKWKKIDVNRVEGLFDQNNLTVSWTFNEDFSTLTNNKGVVFNRVKVGGN